jgi:hypothetical protein
VAGADMEYPLSHVLRLLEIGLRDSETVRNEALSWAIRTCGIERGQDVLVMDASTGERLPGVVEDWGFTPEGAPAVRVEMDEGDGIRVAQLVEVFPQREARVGGA